MENINPSTIGDRHTTTILSAIPAHPLLSSAIGKPPSIGIGQPLASVIGID